VLFAGSAAQFVPSGKRASGLFLTGQFLVDPTDTSFRPISTTFLASWLQGQLISNVEGPQPSLVAEDPAQPAAQSSLILQPHPCFVHQGRQTTFQQPRCRTSIHLRSAALLVHLQVSALKAPNLPEKTDFQKHRVQHSPAPLAGVIGETSPDPAS